jgi:uncharacterized protein (DUF2267 family)
MTAATQPWESALQKSNEWLNQLAPELGPGGPNRALLALRSVLHALRDRLPPNEAVDLAAQLPLLIKGVYFDGWHPSATPVKARSKAEFLGLVAKHAGGRMAEDEAERMTRAVFRLLARHVTSGEVEDIRGDLPAELAEFWPAAAAAAPAAGGDRP